MVLRSGPEAFGYTFVHTTNLDDEEQQAAAAADAAAKEADADEEDIEIVASAASGASASAATTDPQQQQQEKDEAKKSEDKQEDEDEEATKKKPYVYMAASPPTTKGSGGGGSNNGMTREEEAMETSMCGYLMGGCCCCLTIVLLVAGGVLFVSQSYLKSVSDDSDSNHEALGLAAAICMIVGVGACLMGLCACVFGCCTGLMTSSSNGGDGGGGAYEDAHKEPRVQFKRHNDRYVKANVMLESVHFNPIKNVKGIAEAEKKEARQKKKAETKKKNELEAQVKKDLEAGLSVKEIRRNYRPTAFVIRFDGDVMLHGAAALLRKQVGIVVNCARPSVDQAVVVITSPGGAVSSYGLAASQLIRLRKAGIKVVACVDTVAASGGYMMASVADVIYAAPFAVIGSIGVVTQIPNFQRLLNKHDIDAYLFTAGKHKRTIDLIGDVTEENKAKLQEELDEIHRAFKDHIALARPAVRDSIEEIATGEHWLAVHAKEKGLVDDIMTSDEYLESIAKENEIIELVERKKKAAWSGLLAPGAATAAAQSLKDAVVEGFFKSQREGAAPAAIGPPTTPMAVA